MPSLLSWLRRLYSLDTLDTRFTTSATAPANSASDTRPPSAKDARANAIAQNAPAPLWRTPEFFVYYLFFITLVPLMFKTVVDASKGACYWNNHERAGTGMLTGSLDSYRNTPDLPNILQAVVSWVDTWSSCREYSTPKIPARPPKQNLG